MIIYELVREYNPDFITKLYINKRNIEKSEFVKGMYILEKDLFKYEIAPIIKIYNVDNLSHSYDYVLNTLDYFNLLIHEDYPEYLV